MGDLCRTVMEIFKCEKERLLIEEQLDALENQMNDLMQINKENVNGGYTSSDD